MWATLQDIRNKRLLQAGQLEATAGCPVGENGEVCSFPQGSCMNNSYCSCAGNWNGPACDLRKWTNGLCMMIKSCYPTPAITMPPLQRVAKASQYNRLQYLIPATTRHGHAIGAKATIKMTVDGLRALHGANMLSGLMRRVQPTPASLKTPRTASKPRSCRASITAILSRSSIAAIRFHGCTATSRAYQTHNCHARALVTACSVFSRLENQGVRAPSPSPSSSSSLASHGSTGQL
jgi:hypothetical protein